MVLQWETVGSLTLTSLDLQTLPVPVPSWVLCSLVSPLSRIRSDQISRSVMSDSLRPHESQHSRPPCPSPTPRVYPDSHPLSQWYHPTISSSVVPFSSCPQSLPASESLPTSQLFAMRWPKYWSLSFSIIPSKEHPGLISFRMDWLDLLVAQGTLKSLLQHHCSKASIFRCSAFFTVQLSHPYITTLVFPILLFALFLCTDHIGRLSYLSLLFFETLHSNGYIFPFLLCFSLPFFILRELQNHCRWQL